MLCEAGSKIEVVLLDESGLLANAEGRDFAKLFVPECREKAAAFLAELRANRSAFGWELNVTGDARVHALQFAGSAAGEHLLIVAGRSPAEVVRVYTAVRDHDDPRVSEFREHLRMNAPAAASRTDHYSELYDALSRVNNELSNSQRTLAKRTAELQSAQSDLAERRAQLEVAHSETATALEEITRLNAELERRVIDRTRQLEEANRELEGFSYSVSHDLRAPLRHISGFADLLLRGGKENLTAVQQRYLEVISASTKEAGTLVDDLLSFARMGRAALSHARVDMGELTHGIVAEFADERPTTDWVIGTLPEVEGDRSMLRLVMRNLVSNAVKYSRKSEHPRIEIGAIDGDGETLVFVRDNGVGFDMQYVEKLFGVFQRLHRAEEYPGTGIGLAHVRRIIRRHGGRTWAEGEVGRGATFYFSLPNQAVEVTSAGT